MEGAQKDRIKRQIEIAANVGIVIVALVIVASFIGNYRSQQSPSHQSVALGSTFVLKDVNWRSNGQSVVLALSTTCHFCTDSAGFYQRLVKAAKQQRLQTVAVFPQPTDEAHSYLEKEGVSVDETRQADFSSLQISGTPTLLLVDGAGLVKKVWVGKLSGEKENEVLAQLAR